IVQPLLHQGLKYRIGITSGVAYTGIIGGQERCQYAAVGSSINLAARLMMCAEWGEILVGEQVQKERFFKFAFKGNITYKGIMEAVPTFQLVGKKEDEKNDFIGRMVGRDLQLSQLLQFIEPVLHEQNGRVIYIYGEAGIGKSRLAFEAKKNMLDRYDIEWFNCPCDQILRKPFNPFTTFLRQYFEQTSEQQAADNLKSFEIIFQQFIVDCQHSQHPEARSIIQELRRTRSVLAALVGLQTDNSLWEQLDAKGRFENALSAMRNFIMAAALQNPVIVEVEDIHWLDDYSKTLLSDIKKVMPQFPITLFFTARYNDDGSPTLLFERETTPTLQIDLNILSPEALTDFARARLSGGNISNELKEFFLRATNGNPFYIEQLLEYFKENNLLTLLNGEWHIKDNQVRLSDSINAVLTARIDRLSVIVKETVKAAAVIGREFEVPVLVEVMRRNDEYIKANGNTSNVVSEQVKTAERGQIWRAVNELRYIFKHALLREAVYDMQLRTRLRELHYLIAKAIEKLYENNLESRYVDLAYHYEQAERIEETNFYLKHAADNAFRNYQNKQALDFYEKLYSKFKKQNAIAKQVHTLLKMIKVLELTGNWQQCKVYLDTAQELLQEHPTLNITLAGRTYNSLGRLHMLQGAYTQAFEQLQHSVTYFEQDKDEIGLSKVYGDLGNLFLRQGKYEEAKAYFINSIQLGKGVLNPGSLAQNVANLGLTHMNLGEYADAIACQREQLELCKANNDKSGMAVLLTNMGIVCIDKGDYVEAQNCLEEGLQLSRALGNKQLTSIAMGCLGTVFEEQGNYSAARMCYKDDLQIVEELGDKQGIAIVYGLLGGLYSIQGEFEQAIEFLTINLHGCRQLGYKKGIAKALNNLADIYVLKQQFDAAIVHYSEAIQICRQIQNKLVLGQSLIERANIYIKTNQLGDAHTDWQESAGIAQQLGNAELQFDAAIVQGRLLAKKGEVNTAENLYNQLLQKASKEKDSAAIYFELYQLLNRNADKLAARQRYQQLYAKTPQYLYAIRLEILG
ncbi:MAG: tetratricopeptide repeat protein, partial [Saprospiraceae bacterium]